LLWRGIYLMKMPGLNRKVRIATDWLLHALFPPELAQTKVAFESGIRKQHFEPGDIIFQQGDLGDSVYVIEEGQCEALREHNGKQDLNKSPCRRSLCRLWRPCLRAGAS
jgi:NADH dehydrogenase